MRVSYLYEHVRAPSGHIKHRTPSVFVTQKQKAAESSNFVLKFVTITVT